MKCARKGCQRTGPLIRVRFRRYMHRRCFCDEDRRDERAELATAYVSWLNAEFLPPPAPTRKAHPLPVEIGARIGRMVVEKVIYRSRPKRSDPYHLERCYLLRCDCGGSIVVATNKVHRPRVGCVACARRAAGHGLATRYGAHTVRELARRARVSEQSIRQRIRLGWPAEKLAKRRAA